MSKLLEWLCVGVVYLSFWLGIMLDKLPISLTKQSREIVWALPVYLLVVFACYSFGVIGYGVATFNVCEKAADELKLEIEEAKVDLKKKGLKLI